MKKKVNDDQLTKIIELLCKDYSSDDFWLGVSMILQTSVCQKRFIKVAIDIGVCDRIDHMTQVVYYNNAFGFYSLNADKEVMWQRTEEQLVKSPWLAQATPRLPWYACGRELWGKEWKKRRPPITKILSDDFDRLLKKINKKVHPVHLQVSMFFQLSGICRKLRENTVYSAKSMSEFTDLAQRNTLLSEIHWKTKLAVQYNRNAGCPGHLILSGNRKDDIARLKFFKFELEREEKDDATRRKEEKLRALRQPSME